MALWKPIQWGLYYAEQESRAATGAGLDFRFQHKKSNPVAIYLWISQERSHA